MAAFGTWYRWFAWRPVRLWVRESDGWVWRWAWLRTLWRRTEEGHTQGVLVHLYRNAEPKP